MSESRWEHTGWRVGAGIAVGFAAVATGLWLSRSGRNLVREVWQGRRRTRLEDRALDRLWSDSTLSRRPLDVTEVGAGVLELSGAVANEDEAHRAVAMVSSVEDVHAVVNRLTVQSVESRIARLRRRYAGGDAALHESHWYGVEVGTGRRRQSAETDPGRRDDRVPMVSRDLDVQRAERLSSEATEPDVDT